MVGVDGQPTDTFEPLRASVPFPPGTPLRLPPRPARRGGRDRVGHGDDRRGGSARHLRGRGRPARRRAPPIAPLPPNRTLPAAIRLQNAAAQGPRHPAALAAGRGDPRGLVERRRRRARAKPLLRVKRGTPVVLAIKNETPAMQPLHLHGHVFRLLHPFDDGWEPYFLDTVQVPENRTVRIAFVADNPGQWLLASTVLERFDTGLWTWFEVT